MAAIAVGERKNGNALTSEARQQERDAADVTRRSAARDTTFFVLTVTYAGGRTQQFSVRDGALQKRPAQQLADLHRW